MEYDIYNEPQNLVPFIRRADELENDLPIASFYFRQYVLEKLVALRASNHSRAFINTMEKELEKAEVFKKKFGNTFCKEDFRKVCFDFLAVAQKSQDAGENAEKTKELFYYSGLFFDILYHLTPNDTTILDTRKYSKWMATNLEKGFSLSDSQEKISDNEMLQGENSETNEALYEGASVEKSFTNYSDKTYLVPNSDSLKAKAEGDDMVIRAMAIAKASKQTQFASSALSFNDVKLARKYLLLALQLLEDI